MVRWLAGLLFLAIGVERTLRVVAMAGAPGAPFLLFLGMAGEAIGALLAGGGLLMAPAVVSLGLGLFAVFAVVHMGSDLLVYEVRSVLEAAGGLCAALVLVALGWLALRSGPGPRLRQPPLKP